MDDSFVLRIKEHAESQPRGIPFPPVCERDIEEAESRLGFSIPTLLKLIYLKVGNGGFGPGRGGSIIGLREGYASDFGTLVETHEQMKRDQESEGRQWKFGLLPFCEWGCNLFSCVDCKEAHHPVYLIEDFDLWFKNYSLDDFFNKWIEGVDLLSYEGTGSESAEVPNPFTRQPMRVTKRRRKRDEAKGEDKGPRFDT